MVMEKDAPQIHKVVQAQPSLEIWPFVAVVQTSHTPTLLTNPNLPDNPIIFANDAFLRLTGYGRDEILGRNCRFLRGPETDPEATNCIRNAIDEVRPVSTKLLNYRKDGRPFWNQLHISPIFDEVGVLAYYVGYQHDITEQVEAEQALQLARQELEGRLAERERLILEIHHRVRNNLQTIIGLLNLEVGRADPALRNQFNLIAQRVRVLGSIHEQLESFGHWIAIDFARHLREICAGLTTLFEETVAIDVDAEPLTCDVQAAVPLGLIANELICRQFPSHHPERRGGRGDDQGSAQAPPGQRCHRTCGKSHRYRAYLMVSRRFHPPERHRRRAGRADRSRNRSRFRRRSDSQIDGTRQVADTGRGSCPSSERFLRTACPACLNSIASGSLRMALAASRRISRTEISSDVPYGVRICAGRF